MLQEGKVSPGRGATLLQRVNISTVNGSFTCRSKAVTQIACPSSQVMVVPAAMRTGCREASVKFTSRLDGAPRNIWSWSPRGGPPRNPHLIADVDPDPVPERFA